MKNHVIALKEYEYPIIERKFYNEMIAEIEVLIVEGEKYVRIEFGNRDVEKILIKTNDLINLMFEAIREENGV